MSEDQNHPDQDSQAPFDEAPDEEGLGDNATAVEDVAFEDDSWPVDADEQAGETVESIDAVEPIGEDLEFDDEVHSAESPHDETGVEDLDPPIEESGEEVMNAGDDIVDEEWEIDPADDPDGHHQPPSEPEDQPQLAHDIDDEVDDEAGIDPDFEALAEDADEDLQDAAEDASSDEPPAPSIEAQRRTPKPEITVEPLPTPGGFPFPPSLTVCKDQEALQQIDLNEGLTLLGASDNDDDATVDLASWLPEDAAAQRHIAVFKQHKNITLWVLSDEPTQLNDRPLQLGQRASLEDGDIIVLSGQLALRLDLDLTG